MPRHHPWRPHMSDEQVFNPFSSPSGDYPLPEEEEWFDEPEKAAPNLAPAAAERDPTSSPQEHIQSTPQSGQSGQPVQPGGR